MMMVVWNVMSILAEIVTYLPMKGITIPYFVERFVDPSLAFADGWNYWYAYAMLIAAEASAASIVIDYWKPPVSVGVWIAIVLVVILFLNIIAVSFFGEAEFWFASIKLIAILGLIILGIVLFFGGGPKNGPLYFTYWNNPGAFNDYRVSGSTGRFLGYWHAFIAAGFAFITSPELIAIAAGETVAPRRNIPKAARRFTWRLAIFYGLGTLVIGVIVPSTDKRLLGASNASASPFVIGIQRAGIGGLNHVINAAILTSAWSAGNSFLYSGSRILYTMSTNGQAPKFFSITNKKGVPYIAVCFTWIFGLLAFLNLSNTGATVFTWFMNISTISGYVAWIVAMITYLRFRKAMIANGMYDAVPYKAPLQPYATWFILLLVCLITLTNGFQVFWPNKFNASDFLAAYITIPIFFVFYVGHKLWSRRLRFAHKIEDIDVISGKAEMDMLEQMEEPRHPRNWLEKAWYWLA